MPKQSLPSSEKLVGTHVRLPEILIKRIQELAIKDRRSFPQEIRFLLEMAARIREKEIIQEEQE